MMYHAYVLARPYYFLAEGTILKMNIKGDYFISMTDEAWIESQIPVPSITIPGTVILENPDTFQPYTIGKIIYRLHVSALTTSQSYVLRYLGNMKDIAENDMPGLYMIIAEELKDRDIFPYPLTRRSTHRIWNLTDHGRYLLDHGELIITDL